ncbi:MAG: YfhO family protein [Ruminococcaceae bacterium]|nr:YfhO family protein [Oscillospiraceae bacterium]
MKDIVLKKKISLPTILCAASFAVTFLCLYIAFRAVGLGFFGPKSILISDMRQQYIDFFMALRHGDIFYSKGLGLGGDFMGTFTYYLSSPFSLIIFLFKKESLQTALLLIIFLKVSLSSSSFSYMMTNLGYKPDITNIIFSVSYSLMSFVFYFFINLFWLDALIWLPIIITSVQKIVEHGADHKMPFFLSALFISNFYISYMTGLFVALFTIYLCLISGNSLKETLKKVLMLAGYALVAAVMSATILIPAAKNYIFSSAGATKYNLYQTFNFSTKQMISKLFIGHYDSIGNFAAPTIFCGILIFILVLFFFFSREISVKEKVLTALFILFFFLSFLLPSLDIVWHAFAYPNSFAYRYAFCFSFFLIYIAIRGFGKIKSLPYWVFFIPVIISLLLILSKHRLENNLSPASVKSTIFALIIYPVILLIIRLVDIKRLRFFAFILSAVVLFELTLNGFLILKDLNEKPTESSHAFPPYSLWLNQRNLKLALLDRNTGGEDGYFRTADTSLLSINEGVSLRYNGVSAFSSCYNPKIQDLYRKLGYWGEYKKYKYIPASSFIDSFFGVKNVLSFTEIPYMEQHDREGMLSLYRLNTALPVAFAVPSKISYVEFGENVEHNRSLLEESLKFDEEKTGTDSLLSNLAEGSLKITSLKGMKVSGDIDVNTDCLLLFTLPYDDNYSLKIDGKKTSLFEVLDSLMAAELSEGSHNVTLTYYPKESIVGLLISLLALVSYLVFLRKKSSSKTQKPLDV